MNNLLFHIGMGSLSLTRKFHEEHDDTYCGLPSTFLLDDSAFNSTLMASQEVKGQLRDFGLFHFLKGIVKSTTHWLN